MIWMICVHCIVMNRGVVVEVEDEAGDEEEDEDEEMVGHRL